MNDLDLIHRPGSLRTFQIEGYSTAGTLVHLEHIRVTRRSRLDLVAAIARLDTVTTPAGHPVRVTVREVTHIHGARRCQPKHRLSRVIRRAAGQRAARRLARHQKRPTGGGHDITRA